MARMKKTFAQTKPIVTVLADHPILAEKKEPGEKEEGDGFQLEAKLAVAFDILRHKNTQTPVTVAVYGSWGAGKSSAMRWLARQLDEWNDCDESERDGHPKVRHIWFDPWRYTSREQVWRGLIAEVILGSIKVEDATVARIAKATKQFGGFLGRAFLVAASKVAVTAKAPGAEAEVKGELLQEIFDELREATHPEKAFLNDFEDTLRTWVTDTLGEHERMVIFIDDLDRCLPEVTIEVLEALKLYLNIPKLSFVVGVDRSVVDAVVRQRYQKHGVDPDKANQYLDKIFQVEVDISPSQMEMESYIEAQVGALDTVTGGHWSGRLAQAGGTRKPTFQEGIESKVSRLCRDNPREVKRLLNSTLMRARAAEQSEGLGGDKATRFAQGAQVFLLGRFLVRAYGSGTDGALLRKSVQAFFDEWSKFVQEKPDYQRPERSTEPLDDEPERESRAASDEKSDELDPDYASLLARQPRYAGKRLDVMTRRDFHDLMKVPFSSEVAAATAAAAGKEATPRLRRARHDEQGDTKEPSTEAAPLELSDAIRIAIARQLDKPADDLNGEDLRGIETLSLMGTEVTDADLRALASLENLQHLDLDGTGVGDEGASALAALDNLRSLDLRNTQVGNDGANALATLNNLTELDLRNTQVGDDGAKALAALNNLTTLYLSNTQVGDDGANALAAMNNLTSLNLDNTQVGDDGAKALAALNKLTTLFLSNTQVGDDGANALAALNKLTTLFLSNTQVGDDGANALAALNNLKTLSLSNTQVGDDGANALAALNNLRSLNLSNTQVGDDGANALAALNNLKMLYLSNTQVGDDGANALAALNNLTRLFLDNTQVSEAGLAALRARSGLRLVV